MVGKKEFLDIVEKLPPIQPPTVNLTPNNFCQEVPMPNCSEILSREMFEQLFQGFVNIYVDDQMRIYGRFKQLVSPVKYYTNI
jgi:hypothetical protein